MSFGTVIVAFYWLNVIPTQMKIFKIASIVLLFMTCVLSTYSQDNTVVLKRTPEQEAAKQTEKLQQELDLNESQANQVFEINLRYARERQASNKRSESLVRTKNKNEEIKQVLSPEQNDRLQSKRYERTYIETHTLNRNQSVNSNGHRTSPSFRSNRTERVPSSTDMNLRNINNRPVNPNFRPREGSYQNTRRSTSTAPATNRYRNNPPSSHSQPVPRGSHPTVIPNRK